MARRGHRYTPKAYEPFRCRPGRAPNSPDNLPKRLARFLYRHSSRNCPRCQHHIELSAEDVEVMIEWGGKGVRLKQLQEGEAGWLMRRVGEEMAVIEKAVAADVAAAETCGKIKINE